MARLFWLSEEAWTAVEPHLPRGRPGKPRVDERRVIGGILHVLKAGCRWRDTPAAYGPPTTVYNRFNRWSRRGLWHRLFARMATSGGVPKELSLDSSHVKEPLSGGRKRTAWYACEGLHPPACSRREGSKGAGAAQG